MIYRNAGENGDKAGISILSYRMEKIYIQIEF